MTLRNYILLLSFLLSLGEETTAQVQHKLKPGEIVPDVYFPVVLNAAYNEAHLSDFRGKLLILDYWNIWCSSCIAAFPKVTKLQEKFKDDIVILQVSFINKREVVQKFVAKRKGTEDEMKLPLVVFENTSNVLYQSLPPIAYPHYVWIDKDGTYLQSSVSEELTEDNISKAINKQKLGFTIRNRQLDFKPDAPLLLKNNGGPDTAFAYRTMITHYIDSIRADGLIQQFDKKTSRLFAANRSVLELAKYALYKGQDYDIYNKLVQLKGIDRSELIFSNNQGLTRDQWFMEYAYCYELILPSGYSRKDALQFMLQDVERYFRINAQFTMRDLPCLILQRIDSMEHFKSVGPISLARYNSDKTHLQIKGRTIIDFLSFLETKDSPIMIDGTNYRGKIDMDIELGKSFDLDRINRQLRNYGLMLSRESRSFKVVLITKKDK